GSPFDSEIWGRRDQVGKMFGKDDETKKQSFYTSIVAATADLETAGKVAEKIKGEESVRVNALPERKYYEEISKSNAMFQGSAVFIAIIMAIGGTCGLMTTMYAAVSQRIKDIGVLRVVGYAPRQILVSFLLESLLLAVVGGGLGLLIGYAFNGVQ